MEKPRKLSVFIAMISFFNHAIFAGNSLIINIKKASQKEQFESALDSKESYLLGKYYVIGYGTKIDYQKGFDNLKKAHEEENFQATLKLAMCHLASLGTKQDIDEAKKLFNDAYLDSSIAFIDDDDNKLIKSQVYIILCSLIQKEITVNDAYIKLLEFENEDWTSRYCLAHLGERYKLDIVAKSHMKTEEELFHQAVINQCFKDTAITTLLK